MIFVILVSTLFVQKLIICCKFATFCPWKQKHVFVHAAVVCGLFHSSIVQVWKCADAFNLQRCFVSERKKPVRTEASNMVHTHTQEKGWRTITLYPFLLLYTMYCTLICSPCMCLALFLSLRLRNGRALCFLFASTATACTACMWRRLRKYVPGSRVFRCILCCTRSKRV